MFGAFSARRGKFWRGLASHHRLPPLSSAPLLGPPALPMAADPQPRMRVSRSGPLYDSQPLNYPSALLHDSQQLQETSAPFPEQPSDEYSAWSLHQRRSEAQHEDEDDESSHRSSDSATPGPSRTTAVAATPHGASRLRDVIHRLNSSPNTSTTPRPPPPRSEADSDLLELDTPMKSAGDSIRAVFKKARAPFMSKDEEYDVSTPKQAQSGSRIPVSGERKQRRLSLERASSSKDRSRRKSTSDDEGETSRRDSGLSE